MAPYPDNRQPAESERNSAFARRHAPAESPNLDFEVVRAGALELMERLT